ncbi:hypothetical protein AOLI_G00180720 [Acnodon oligacanthus]
MIPHPRKTYKAFVEDEALLREKNPPRRKKQYKVFLEDDSEEPPRNTIIRGTSNKTQREDRRGSCFADEGLQWSNDDKVETGEEESLIAENFEMQTNDNENYSSNITEDATITTIPFIPDGDKPLYPGAKLTKGEKKSSLITFIFSPTLL